MIAKAPDFYPVDSAQLAEEMRHVEIASSMQWGGTFTLITGVRHYPGATPQPILIIKSGGRVPMDLIAIPGID